MDKYKLSDEGRARFKRTRIRMYIEGKDKMEGYEVLDYLYEHGAATVLDIGKNTGLSWSQVVNRLGAFIHWGYVERLAEQLTPS